jgi:hypothetical protein
VLSVSFPGPAPTILSGLVWVTLISAADPLIVRSYFEDMSPISARLPHRRAFWFTFMKTSIFWRGRAAGGGAAGLTFWWNPSSC